MPNSKKKKHGRHGKTKGAAAGSAPDGGAQEGGVSPQSPTAAPGATSQPKPPASTPAVPVSTVKPAEFEKAAAPATEAAVKPAAKTAAAGGAAEKKASGATAPKESPKSTSKAEPAKAQSSKPADGAHKAVKAAEGKSQEVKPKETPKGAPVSPTKGKPVKAEPAAAAAGVDTAAKKGKPEEVTPKQKSKTKPCSPSKTGPAKPATAVDEAAKTAEAAVGKGKPEEAKPKETPKSKSTEPSKVGPAKAAAATAAVSKETPKEVKPNEDPKKPAVDPFAALADSLPSEAPVPTAPVYTGPEVKERDVTKEDTPVCGEDDDTLPPGYRYEDMDKNVPADVPKPEKPMTTGEALDSLSLGFTSSAPPSVEKKEPKVEDVSAIDALSAGFSNSASPPPTTQKKAEEVIAASASSAGPLKSAAPPADKKAKLEKGADDFSLMGAVESPKPPADKKPKTDESISLDALSALEDLLPAAEPAPEPPKVRPEDMVKEGKMKSKDAVRVGEDDETIPPEYRFKEEDLKDLPPPKVEPTMDTGEALDILSGGFDTPAVAPTVQAPVPPSTKPPKKDAVDAVGAPSGDLASCYATPKIMAPPPQIIGPKKDAVGAVGAPSGDLASCYATPKIMAPPPQLIGPKEPAKSAGDPLDVLSGDLASCQATPKVMAPLPQVVGPKEKAPPTVAAGPTPSPAPAAPTAPKTDESLSLDALSALGDLLPAAEPVPEPPKVRPEDMVKVDKLKSEDAVRVGEDDETIPPEYRFKEEDLKNLPPPKVEPTMDTGEALDILSGGFDAPAVAPTVQAPLPPSTKTPKEPSKKDGDLASCQAAPKVMASLPQKVEPPKLQATLPATAVPKKPPKAAGDPFDALSGDLASCKAAPQLQTTLPATAVPKKADADFSLDSLASDVVASTAAPAVQTEPQLSSGATDALEALSDTLTDIAPAPAPQPAPIPAKDVVKEKEIVEEKIIKMGERDDTLPPEFRLTEEEIKEMEKEKAKGDVQPKEKPMGEAAALDLLSGDFSTPAAPAAPTAQAAVSASAAPQTQSAAPPAEQMPSQKGPVLDALAKTLIPGSLEAKPKESPAGDKPKKQAAVDTSAVDELSGQLASDVVPTSPAKKSSKS